MKIITAIGVQRMSLLLPMLICGFALRAADDPKAATKPLTGLGIWIGATPSAAPLSPAALVSMDGFTRAATGEPPAIAADAVMSNGRLTAVFRKQCPAIELYSTHGETSTARATLTLVAADDGAKAEGFDRVVVIENTKGSVCLEGSYKTANGRSIVAKFRLKKGDTLLEVEPGAGAAKLYVDCTSRFAVLPDFFADDIVINPQKFTPNTIEIPSENFLLQLVGDGEAMVMSVFESKANDAKLLLSGEAEKRLIAGAEIEFGTVKADVAGGVRPGKIWLSVFEGPHIWHALEIKKSDAGKILPLDWTMPIPAVWRVDFSRPNDLTDSWTMLLQEKAGGEYQKPSWLSSGEDTLDKKRKRWNTVLGTFAYPAWSDPEMRGFLQPLKSKEHILSGAVVIYPIARIKQTPRDAFTVFDVIRNSLGVGPCEYILDLEGQKGEYRGRATCNTRDTLAGIYQSNQQKEKRAQVDKILDEALAFCTHIRGRINRYVEFGHAMRAYLGEQKKDHPELSAYIDEMDKILAEIDARYDARKEKIRTLEYVAQLNADFRKNVLEDFSNEALAKCKKYGHDLVEVGDNQDELSSECRWVVKSLRQRAGLLLATTPKAASIAAEIRARTQVALRSPANHEGAQH